MPCAPPVAEDNNSHFSSCLFRDREYVWNWSQAASWERDLFPCLKSILYTHTCKAKLGNVGWTQWKKLYLHVQATDIVVVRLAPLPEWQVVPCHPWLFFAWKLKMAVSPSKYPLVTGLITESLLLTLTAVPWGSKTYFSRGAGWAFSSLMYHPPRRVWSCGVSCWSVPRSRFTFIQFQYTGMRERERRADGQFSCSQGFLMHWKHFIYNSLARILSPRMEQEWIKGNLDISSR